MDVDPCSVSGNMAHYCWTILSMIGMRHVIQHVDDPENSCFMHWKKALNLNHRTAAAPWCWLDASSIFFFAANIFIIKFLFQCSFFIPVVVTGSLFNSLLCITFVGLCAPLAFNFYSRWSSHFVWCKGHFEIVWDPEMGLALCITLEC